MNTDMLNEARRDITDVVEEVGAVCTHLREAMDFADNGNVPSAVASVEDAQDAIDNAMRELTKIRDRAGRWAVWAERQAHPLGGRKRRMNTTESQPPDSLGAATGSAIVVCLCGSSRWPELHHRVMMSETLAGNIVIPMGLYGHADYPPGAKAATNDGDEATAVKQMLDRLHYRKIDLADEIIVVSEDGYFGSSTRREIAYAQAQGKRVRYCQNDKDLATAPQEPEPN